MSNSLISVKEYRDYVAEVMREEGAPESLIAAITGTIRSIEEEDSDKAAIMHQLGMSDD